MKNLTLFIFSFFLISSSTNSDIDKRIDSIMSDMSIEQKIGQMAQINLTVIANGPDKWSSFEPLQIDKDRIEKAINKYHVGSILNTTNNRARDISTWNKIIDEIQSYALSSKTAIPILYGIDGIHGATYIDGATMFPQQIGTAATWDIKNSFNMGMVTAYETRAAGIPWNFSPVLDLGQDPRFPRQFETFGEDPYLTTQMGLASLEGQQGIDNNMNNDFVVATSIKHFLGYQTTISGKDRTPSYIPEHVLRELHLPAFEKAISQGAKTIMINSGLINGIPVHADRYLLTDLLRDELGFDGIILTDWEDINKLHDRDKVAESRKEAIKIAINAGIDMSMIPYDYEEFCDNLLELVKEGEISEARIDESVRRILKLKIELGLFDKKNKPDYSDFGSQTHQNYAYAAAVESMTLLKNENSTLPIRNKNKILVTGPNGDSMRTLNGAWTYSWQGEKTDFFAGDHNTIYEAIKNKFTDSDVKYIPGVTYPINEDYDKEPKFEYYDQYVDQKKEAIKYANEEADIIVLCLGENTYTEKPGDLNDINLNRLQIDFANEIIKSGKPVVLVLNIGRPRLISEIESKVNAVINIYLPGNFGGDALADILYGSVNPSGKLPYSYPLYSNSLIPYNYKPAEVQNNAQGAYNYVGEVNNLYDFGFGLSYTSFEYSNLKLNSNQFSKNENIYLSVDIKNTGEIEGKEVIQVYSKDHYASLTPDIKRLRAFKKIKLKPGEIKNVKFEIQVQDLGFVNYQNKHVVETGKFDLMVGSLKSELIIK
ncbi:glycoside hydrolase family 3 C-terminal domain-containing protein [Flavobacteriaceae bacterium]|nr:glycoside hydrolase family 3 C-terminal domain-containing protein [Flavobacteriaceae bacterium]